MKAVFRRSIASLLEFQVRRLIAKRKPLVIAVAGSVGKTSTKIAIAHVLKQKYPGQVLLHEGNYNSEVSLPLSIFGLDLPGSLFNPLSWIKLLWKTNRVIRKEYPYKVLVLELGTDHPGEIARFMRYLQPDYGVVTAITPEHMEFFKTIDAVAEEEFTLAIHARKPVLNFDDARIKNLAKSLDPQTLLTYGKAGNVSLAKSSLNPKGYAASIASKAPSKNFTVQTSLLGEHGFFALLAAVAIAIDLEVSDEQIKTALETFQPVSGRMARFAGKHNSLIIDDTYNSSPEAATAALTALYALPGNNKIAILGNMNELGDESEAAHKRVGEDCTSLNLLITIGDMAEKWLAPAAVQAGLNPEFIKSFSSPYDAGNYVLSVLQEGDVVLAKGSQNKVFAEEAVKILLEHPEDAAKLVRQSAAWLAKKQVQFRPVNP